MAEVSVVSEKQPQNQNLTIDLVNESIATKQFLQKISTSSQEYLYITHEKDRFICEVRSKVKNAIGSYNHASYRATRFFEKLPEAKRFTSWERRNQFAVAATDLNCLAIWKSWGIEKIKFHDPASEQEFKAIIARFIIYANRARIQAEFKINNTLPSLPSDFIDNPELPLSDYQKAAFSFANGQESTALYMDKGTGKTAVVISRICNEAKRYYNEKGHMYKCLIICPNKARLNWQNEFARFATTPGKTTIIRAPKIERIRQFLYAFKSEENCAFTAVIIGYDTIAVDIDFYKEVPWDLVVADESHYIKDHRTKRAKALLGLQNNAMQKMTLTGTPIGNSVLDLWTQLEFLGQGCSGFSSFAAFKKFYGRFEEQKSGFGVKKLIGITNQPVLQEKLAGLAFQITKEEAGLKLPDKLYEIVEVDMTSKQTDVYNKMVSQISFEIERERQESELPLTMTAEHVLTRLLRLAQITSGFIKTDSRYDELGTLVSEGFVSQIDEKNPKIDATVELIKEQELEAKTIVWACWVEDLEEISRRLTQEGIHHGLYYGKTSSVKRDQIYHDFNNDPDMKVIVANPRTAGDALNLIGYNPDKPEMQTYCDLEIFFSQNWSFFERSQAEDRAHRRGTRNPVRIVDLVVPDTIDEEIRNRVAIKQSTADMIRDVAVILQRVLHINIV